MGKNKKAAGIGRTLIKDRFGNKPRGSTDSFRQTSSNTQWRCSSRRKDKICYANVTQRGDIFSTGTATHNHAADPLMKKKVTLKRDLHTSELNDGYDWGRLNLQSVTEQDNLADFLTTAEMAGTEFTAEKLNVQFINKDNYSGLPEKEELSAIKDLHKQHAQLLSIPRRPRWTNQMSASLLDQNEKEAFLEWRRTLSSLQEVEGIVMTPYEKNLDFWRQLWRVIERSDIVVQIVDARNPLLFYCSDLETYVHEVNPDKLCLLLINKADFLDQIQRDIWADYFSKRGIRIAFWSALAENARQEQKKTEDKHEPNNEEVEESDSGAESSDEDYLEPNSGNEAGNQKEIHIQNAGCSDSDVNMSEGNSNLEGRLRVDNDQLCENESTENKNGQATTKQSQKDVEMEQCSYDTSVDNLDTEGASKTDFSDSGGVSLGKGDNSQTDSGDVLFDKRDSSQSDNVTSATTGAIDKGDNSQSDNGASGGVLAEKGGNAQIANTGYLYPGEELLNLLRSLHTGEKVQGDITTVGMVGYPNVGKSSTINAILQMKKVPVSATPGRTKHFQTLFVEPTLMLCDCPGLVYPSFVTTKADLIVSSILPIDQMRDHIPPSSLVCQTIPRHVLEKTYGIIIPPPGEAEDPDRPPSANELLRAYGAMRGFMTHHGVPDCARAARLILKDYVTGKLLYCHPPPDVDPALFHVTHGDNDARETNPAGATGIVSEDTPVPSRIDGDFFRKSKSTVHSRTARSGGVDVAGGSGDAKPWKHHNNRNKKEKIRRVYGYLDD